MSFLVFISPVLYYEQVGIAACQIARALGFTVLGTAGTAEGIELVLKNGAHKAFNHREKGYLAKITVSSLARI